MKFLNDRQTVLRAEAAGGAEGGGAPVDNTAAMAALQSQIDALKADGVAKDAQITEKDQAARYWHDEAKKSGKAASKADTPIETPDTDEDAIELLSKQGSKGFKALGLKQGFVTEEQLNNAIEARATQMTDEAALTKEYPDLLDKNTPFFKETAAYYNALLAQNVPRGVAMQQAAKNAALDGIRSGKIVSKAQQEEADAHAAAAGGDKSRRGPKTPDPKDDELDDFQKNLCEQMGVTEKAYKERANKGVVYSGGPRF